jgi:hypothetical protein
LSELEGIKMTGLRQRFLGLCLPPILFCVLDFTLTLVFQPAEYWQGDRTSIIEGSPTFHYLLTVHPAAFVVGVSVWIALFVALLLLLPDTPALITSIAIVSATPRGRRRGSGAGSRSTTNCSSACSSCPPFPLAWGFVGVGRRPPRNRCISVGFRAYGGGR